MLIPFEKSDLFFPDVVANDVVQIPVPSGRCFINKFVVAEHAAGAFNATLYNRRFTNPVGKLATITTASGYCKLTFTLPHPFRKDDVVVVAGTSVGGYHTNHMVTAVLSDRELITSVAFDSNATGGTGTLVIPIATITAAGTKTLVKTHVPHLAKAGDALTLAATGVGGYNTTHNVIRVLDPKTVLTDVDYSADVATGTLNLAIATTEQPLFEVIPATTAIDGVVRQPSAISGAYACPCYNQDVPRDDCGIARYVYIKFSANGDYRVAIAGQMIS